MTITAFFRDGLRAPLNNSQWSWGAIEPSANRVFLRVWDDQMLTDAQGEWVQVFWKPRINSPGYPERASHLDAIRNGAEGIGIVCTAVDPATLGRRRIRKFDADLLLRLGELVEDDNGIFARVLARVPVDALAQGSIAADVAQIFAAHVGDPTTAQALINARVGQGVFRASVLQLWAHRCAVTGSTTVEVLRASHIKPWRDATDAERLDPANGLPLVASLDALFDAGLISFDAAGAILVSERLGPSERAIHRLTGLALAHRPSAPTAQYLRYHRSKFAQNKLVRA